jgi:hypothetical protein
MNPANPRRAMSWTRFGREGLMTPYGRSTPGAVAAQVLILPALILVWDLAVVMIGAVAA